MEEVNFSNLNLVTSIGIGGGDLYYISNFLLDLGIIVSGFDIRRSERTDMLEKRGVNIEYRNPKGKLPRSDLIIYSDSLPDLLINQMMEENDSLRFIEVGDFKRLLIEKKESNTLSDREIAAIKSSDVLPLYDLDLSSIKLIGVTGTDGKTTVSSMIYHILSRLGYKPGMINTLGIKIGDENIETGFHVTTPSSQEIKEALLKMQEEKCTHVILECTSQGLFMGRLAGIKFDIAVFTNIKSDHLGYHKSWDRYLYSKSLLIRENLKEGGTVILNSDDEKTLEYLKDLSPNSLLYSIRSEVDVYASDIKESFEGLSFSFGKHTRNIPILGRYNISNALASVASLEPLGIEKEKSMLVLDDFRTVDGRMNVLQRKPFTVIVDFAHTPNGLLSVLQTLENIKAPKSKLILVFGCAAKRDEYKRPVMGSYAKQYADITILTAEDSRTEDLREINNQIEKGWQEYNIDADRKLVRFDDETQNVKGRRDAIKEALSRAHEGDIVLITGKGHEKSLCFGTREFPWNDIEETRKLLKEFKHN